MNHGLYLDPAGVPGRRRAELPLSLKKPAIRGPLWHGFLGKREPRFAIQFPGNDGLPYYHNCGLVGKGKGTMKVINAETIAGLLSRAAASPRKRMNLNLHGDQTDPVSRFL